MARTAKIAKSLKKAEIQGADTQTVCRICGRARGGYIRKFQMVPHLFPAAWR